MTSLIRSVIAASALTMSLSSQDINSRIVIDMPKEISIIAETEDDEMLALLTMAEAEGESEYGKRLVIDSVLNRMDSEAFPDTIRDVIYQKNQYSSMTNGRVYRCYVDEDIHRLVKEELFNRTNSEVIFFRTGTYSEYGQPLFKVGNHYFSSY